MKKQTLTERASLAYWMARKYEPSYPRPLLKDDHTLDEKELHKWYRHYIKTRCNGKEIT